MIYEHRTYTVAHGLMPEYLARYEKHALPIQLRHLGRLLGFFVSEIGPLNQVVHVWAYDSLADRETRRAPWLPTRPGPRFWRSKPAPSPPRT